MTDHIIFERDDYDSGALRRLRMKEIVRFCATSEASLLALQRFNTMRFGLLSKTFMKMIKDLETAGLLKITATMKFVATVPGKKWVNEF